MNSRKNTDFIFSSAVARLEAFLATQRKQRIAIYGMGQHSRDLIDSMDLKHCLEAHDFLGFFQDSEYQAALFHGYPCLLRELAVRDADLIVLSSDVYEAQMQKRLAEEGFTGQVFRMYGEQGVADFFCAHRGEILALDNAASFTLRFDRLAPAYGMEIRRLASSTVLAAKRETAERWMRNHADTDLDKLSFEGLNLFEMSRGTLACYLNCADVGVTGEHEEAARNCITDTVAFLMGYKDIFSRPDRSVRLLLIMNGFWNDVWAASAMARRNGIQVVATELSFFPGLVYVEPITGKVANDTMLATCSDVYLRGRALSSVQSRLVRTFFSTRKPEREWRADHFSQPGAEDHAALRARLNIGEEQRVAIAIMQVASDTTIVYDNPLYSDNTTFVRDLIPWFEQHPEWALVIKPHPKELKGLAARGKVPLENVTYRRLRAMLAPPVPSNIILTEADATNIYSLFSIADFAVTINSQSGLEFSAHSYRRTIVLGKAAYGGKGFTVDVSMREAIRPVLDAVATRPILRDEEIGRMECFLYHMLFEYLYPVCLETDTVRREHLVRLLRGGSLSVSGLLPRENINPAPPDVNTVYRQGAALLRKVEGFGDAINYKRTYQFFDHDEPVDSGALAKQGMEAFQRSEFRAAALAFDKAVSLEPRKLEWRIRYAVAEYRLGNVRRARNALRVAQLLNPDAFSAVTEREPAVADIIGMKSPRDVDPPYYGPQLIEQVDLIESVMAAEERFTLLELGAGFGCWITYANAIIAKLGRQLETAYCAVEAEPSHYEFLEEHLEFNRIPCRTIHGAVTDHDGVVHVEAGTPFTEYGWGLGTQLEVRSLSLDTILGDYPFVDLIDADLQGAESLVFPVSQLLPKRVRKVQVATHSSLRNKPCDNHRIIQEYFLSLGWIKVTDYVPYSFSNTYLGMMQFIDGMQTWMNPLFLDRGRSKNQAFV